MMTKGQQMSCERPETLCYPSGERETAQKLYLEERKQEICPAVCPQDGGLRVLEGPGLLHVL
jgi:hypothetical protein